ncbi:MAG TPA: LysE family transporter [Candidatus Methanomethylicus sp.]|nr:LysE family transporter [Candidatus Methanomethylicus sp.]
MIEPLLIVAVGVGLGLSISAPPGPVNVLIAVQAASGSRKNGFLVGLGALSADAAFLVATYCLGGLLVFDSLMQVAFSLVSSALLAYLAFLTYRSARRLSAFSGATNVRVRYPYIAGLTMGLTNPFQITWWVSVGLLLISSIGPLIIAGFFIGILVWITSFPIIISWLSHLVSSLYRVVVYVSVALLLAFSLYFLTNALLLIPSL